MSDDEYINVRMYGGPFPGTYRYENHDAPAALFSPDAIGYYARVGFGLEQWTCRRGCCRHGEVEVADYEWVAQP